MRKDTKTALGTAAATTMPTAPGSIYARDTGEG